MLVGLSAITLLAAAPPSGAVPDVPPSRFTDPERKKSLLRVLPAIDVLMSDGMKELDAPGLAYAVVIDDEVVSAKGLGVRDVGTGAPVDADTVFRIASMTKSFTAMAILKLRDAGKLRLDDPVSRHVPELAGWQLPTRDSGPITIRHLLAHTSGLPEDNPQGDRVLDMTDDAFAAWLKSGVPFSTATGSEFEYSNLGFMILGRVITQVSGRPFQAYITEELMLPLGMRSTYWSLSQVPPDRLALGYRREKEAWVAEPMLDDGAGAAMGGLLTTSRDLARYIAMLLAAYPPRDEPESAPVLRSTLREMQSGLGSPEINVSRSLAGGPLTGRGSSYGYGLGSVKDCGWGREVGHGGGLPGFGSHMRWLPDRGVGVLVFANLTYADAWKLTRGAMEQLQSSGALKPRQPMPSAALVQMARAASDLIIDWRDEKLRAIAADNLLLDQSLDDRRTSISGMREGLGACRSGKLDAENALRGKLRIDCDKGWMNVALTLAPLQPPRVQFLEVVAGRPPSPELRNSAEAVTKAVATGARDLRLAPKVSRSDLAATLESTRLVYGSCKLGETIDGDGVSKASFTMDCDRGALEMALSVADGRVAGVKFSPAADAACVP